MVSSMFAKSIGMGGSKAIKTRSIPQNAGMAVRISPMEKSSNGALGAAKPIHKTTHQNMVVNAGTGSKGNGGNVDRKATIMDPLQMKKGGSRYAK